MVLVDFFKFSLILVILLLPLVVMIKPLLEGYHGNTSLIY